MEESFAMNGGDCPYSYSKYSKLQAKRCELAKSLLTDSILEKLELKDETRVFNIVDLGCSVGPNTFTYVQTVIDAIKLKFDNQIDFHVFFNDQVMNDFNALFKHFCSEKRNYFAAGVPGSFYNQLFPKASMDFMISYSALHWLKGVPEEVTDENSSVWNKGSITFVNSSNEIVDAFGTHFFKGLKSFLDARSVELAPDGLLVIYMPCRPDGHVPSESFTLDLIECLGDVLNDMAIEGLVKQSQIDSFNVPIFLPTLKEVEEMVSKNERFNIEVLKKVKCPEKLESNDDVKVYCAHSRAGLEGMLSKQFGPEIIDEVFERYAQKIIEFRKTSRFRGAEDTGSLFLVIKRRG